VSGKLMPRTVGNKVKPEVTRKSFLKNWYMSILLLGRSRGSPAYTVRTMGMVRLTVPSPSEIEAGKRQMGRKRCLQGREATDG